MIRKIIQIDEEKCNGCGLCAEACHEGAIGMVDGKAKLLRDDYCDGLGDCLPVCPMDAIHFVEREAAAYDEVAVKAHMAEKHGTADSTADGQHKGCKSTAFHGTIRHNPEASSNTETASADHASIPSALQNWPTQIKLAPINAPYFEGADLLIAADCTAYAYGDFHRDFIRGKILLMGCPKLDMVDYSEKLTEIFQNNDIRSITLTRMEVPCCGGMEYAVKQAIAGSGKEIPLKVVTIGIDGALR